MSELKPAESFEKKPVTLINAHSIIGKAAAMKWYGHEFIVIGPDMAALQHLWDRIHPSPLDTDAVYSVIVAKQKNCQ